MEPGSWWPLEDPNSCNGFFGNGFTDHFNMLPVDSGAQFNCSYHPGTTFHVCEAGKVVDVRFLLRCAACVLIKYVDVYAAMLYVDASKMKMVDGGEVQESARHREENDEIPSFSSGAFKIKVQCHVQQLISVHVTVPMWRCVALFR